MLKILRQCATIQITVKNEADAMVFDQSCGVDAPGYLEHLLTDAMRHEVRIVEGKIANQYFDRIAALQRRIKELEGKRPPIQLKSESVIDAEFIALPAPKGGYNA